MARKTTTTTVNRRNKTEVPVTPVQVAPELQKETQQAVSSGVSNIGRKNGEPANQHSASAVSVNVEEEIRRRAYELYLQRSAGGSLENGNPNQDWLVAEREICSRLGVQKQMAAAAGATHA